MNIIDKIYEIETLIYDIKKFAIKEDDVLKKQKTDVLNKQFKNRLTCVYINLQNTLYLNTKIPQIR